MADMAKFWKEKRNLQHSPSSPPSWDYKVEECGVTFSYLRIEDIRVDRNRFSEWGVMHSARRLFHTDMLLSHSRPAWYVRWWLRLSVWSSECNLMLRHRKQIIRALDEAHEYFCAEQARET
jgi:hypothetical protein